MNTERLEAQKKRVQKKLYEKGLITQKEYEMIQEEKKPVKEIKEMISNLEKIKDEIEECYKTDYLDENNPVGLKYGCVSIYSPKYVKGLKLLCFKIRGLFQTMPELDKRIKKLENLYPNDRIYKFEVGKWCPYSENDTVDNLLLLKQLNYSMKCYLENLEHEKEEFEKRKKSLQQKTDQESKLVNAKNKKDKKKSKKKSNEQNKVNNDLVNTIPSAGENEDDKAIQKIINYLEDPELKNKFSVNKSTLQTVEIDMNQKQNN